MSAPVIRAAAVVLLSAVALLAEPGSGAWRGERAAVAAAADLAPRADVQEAIGRVARAKNEAELESALADLRRLSAPDRSELVPQLALFLLSASGEREGMAPAIIVDRLEISRDEIVRGVTPHLSTSDPALRAQLENLLGHDD